MNRKTKQTRKNKRLEISIAPDLIYDEERRKIIKTVRIEMTRYGYSNGFLVFTNPGDIILLRDAINSFIETYDIEDGKKEAKQQSGRHRHGNRQ